MSPAFGSAETKALFPIIFEAAELVTNRMHTSNNDLQLDSYVQNGINSTLCKTRVLPLWTRTHGCVVQQ